MEEFATSIRTTNGKAIPAQAHGVAGGLDSQIFRHTNGTVVSPAHRPPLPPRKYSWYLFLLEAASIAETYCDRKECINEKFQ
jgi:hypothetical protein